jgi:membrane protease YdiL (CAAX protease family)
MKVQEARMGMGMAWLRLGGPQWPTLGQTISPIANNVFFTAVEELEFRGFLLSFLLRAGMRSTGAVWLQAIVHTLTHIHRLMNPILPRLTTRSSRIGGQSPVL